MPVMMIPMAMMPMVMIPVIVHLRYRWLGGRRVDARGGRSGDGARYGRCGQTARGCEAKKQLMEHGELLF